MNGWSESVHFLNIFFLDVQKYRFVTKKFSDHGKGVKWGGQSLAKKYLLRTENDQKRPQITSYVSFEAFPFHSETFRCEIWTQHAFLPFITFKKQQNRWFPIRRGSPNLPFYCIIKSANKITTTHLTNKIKLLYT